MRESVEKIISVSFSEVEKSKELTLLVLSVYSKLFLKSQAPSNCGFCLNKFYNEIISNGLQKIEFMANKTSVLKKGLHYVRQENKHFSNDNLSDEKAIELLKKGYLSPSVFEALPKGYNAPKIDKQDK